MNSWVKGLGCLGVGLGAWGLGFGVRGSQLHTTNIGEANGQEQGR